MTDQGATPRSASARHSELVAQILDKLCPLLVGGAAVAYARGAEGPKAVAYVEHLRKLGFSMTGRPRMPDVIVHMPERNWLRLIDTVTGNGPISPARRSELAELFSAVTAGLIFVTAVPDRRTMAEFFSDIAWRTEVWVADEPGHVIHLDGQQVHGPATTGSHDTDLPSNHLPIHNPQEAQ